MFVRRTPPNNVRRCSFVRQNVRLVEWRLAGLRYGTLALLPSLFPVAVSTVPKELFQEILRLIADYSHSHHQRLRKTPDGPVFNSYRWEECVQIPAKMVRSAPRPMFGLPELTVAARTSLLSC